MRRLAGVVACCLLLGTVGLTAQAGGAQRRPAPPRPPRCGDDARAQARKLLALHMENDARIEIAKDAKALPSVRNPADASQRIEVVEVWGFVAKGQYRMRFLYVAGYSPCTLVGQELLEYGRF